MLAVWITRNLQNRSERKVEGIGDSLDVSTRSRDRSRDHVASHVTWSDLAVVRECNHPSHHDLVIYHKIYLRTGKCPASSYRSLLSVKVLNMQRYNCTLGD